MFGKKKTIDDEELKAMGAGDPEKEEVEREIYEQKD